MSFKIGDLFPKKPINEPHLDLNDVRWNGLEGGYRGVLYNPSLSLQKLKKTEDVEVTKEVYQELWQELHHQGDVGLASYYAVPHLINIAKEKKSDDLELICLVSVIEIQRHKNNPKLPSALLPAYMDAINELGILVQAMLSMPWDIEKANVLLTALALSKGQVKLANAILNLDSEDTIDEFLKQY